MRFAAFDLESSLIAPGRQAPPIVCGAIHHGDGRNEVWETERLFPKLVALIRDPDAVIVNHNVVFDLGLLAQHDPTLIPEIFKLFHDGRVYDTFHAETLISVAKNGDAKASNSLAAVVLRRLGIKVSGKDESDAWRLRYAQLKGVPIEQYPAAARDYVVDDAVYAMRVMYSQVAECQQRFGCSTLPMFKDLMYEAWCMWLMSAWGAHSDGWVVSELSSRVKQKIAEYNAKLQLCGLQRKDGSGSTDTYALKLAVIKDYGSYHPPEDALCVDVPDMPAGQASFAALLGPVDAPASEGGNQVEEELERIYNHTHLGLVYDDLAKAAAKRYPKRLGGEDRGLRELRRVLLNLGEPDKIPLTNFENGSAVEGAPKPSVSTKSDILKDGNSDDLTLLAEAKIYDALDGKYIPPLRKGTRHPIHCRWSPCLATYRTSCSGPNWQNQPRFEGPRECVVPSYHDWVFIASDYSTAELRSLAQVCLHLFGFSRLAEVINPSPEYPKGRDPHLLVVAGLLSLSYEETFARKGEKLIKKLRNLAKALNFGLPGGLGARKFIAFAKASYGVSVADYAPAEYWPGGVVNLAAPDAVKTKVAVEYFTQVLKPQWLETYPEIKMYFKYIGSLTQGEDHIRYTHPLTGFVRGQVWYTRACNHNFQHLTAVGAKRALCQVIYEAYCVKDSPLFGFRVPFFVHDEIIIEGPQSRAAAAAARLEAVMVEHMNALTPDVKAETDAHIMRRWRKKAEQTIEDGVLIPFEDRKNLQHGLGDPLDKVLSECNSVYDVFLKVGVEYQRAKRIFDERVAPRLAA